MGVVEMVYMSILLQVQSYFHTTIKCLPGIVIPMYLLLSKENIYFAAKMKIFAPVACRKTTEVYLL